MKLTTNTLLESSLRNGKVVCYTLALQTLLIYFLHRGTIVKDIVDISHDNPVYDPRNFGNGVKYHKLPTVSKIPPTDMVRPKIIQRRTTGGPTSYLSRVSPTIRLLNTTLVMRLGIQGDISIFIITRANISVGRRQLHQACR